MLSDRHYADPDLMAMLHARGICASDVGTETQEGIDRGVSVPGNPTWYIPYPPEAIIGPLPDDPALIMIDKHAVLLAVRAAAREGT